ncbi:MAG: GTPase HflX, partial [Planctomycetaceae bacterium]|nr:GTPase HflX [Planctomycetaceae bacterium]
MGDPKRDQLKVGSQRGILVGVFHPDDGFSREGALDELKGLVKTAGMEVVGEVVQFRETPHTSLCIGRGKLEELKAMIAATDAEVIVFDNNLSPSQGRALEQSLEKPIVDRSEVILDIFATHARTYEAMLQ